MAFVFLNHYLDIVDAIQEGDPSLVDNSLFEGSDIPIQFTLPQTMFLSVSRAFQINLKLYYNRRRNMMRSRSGS